MSQEDTASVTQLLAKSNPRVLLDALRSNGFWIYAIHKGDLDDAFDGSKANADLSPVTDDDMNYVNHRDSNKGVISDHSVDYNTIINEIGIQIRDYRNAKNNLS